MGWNSNYKIFVKLRVDVRNTIQNDGDILIHRDDIVIVREFKRQEGLVAQIYHRVLKEWITIKYDFIELSGWVAFEDADTPKSQC